MNYKISIIVISYNSEKTIIDTLESIKNQSYLNYEVIISDDCSTDKTIEVTKKWCKNNSINNYKILESNINEGVTKNINKALKEIKGEWIKLIAADDILLPNCLIDNLNFVNKNKNIKICFSKVKTFGKQEIILPIESKIKLYNFSIETQYKELKWNNYIVAPTSFINKKLFEKYGFFDERIPMLEDIPYWSKLLSKKEKIYFLDKVTVHYRIAESLSNHQEKIEHIATYQSKKLYYRYYLEQDSSLLLKWHYKLEFFIKDFLIKLFDNKSNNFTRVLLKYYKIIDIGYIIKKFEWGIK